MNRFAFSALAVCAASSLTFANESEEWLTLDNEIENLSTALPQGGSGLGVSGFLKTAYWNSSDPFAGGTDVGGFSLDNARVNLDGSVGNFNVHVALEGNTTSEGVGTPFTGTGGGLLGGFGHFRVPAPTYGVAVLDAYGDWNFTDTWYVRAGLFRAPVLKDSLRDENQMIFWHKTVIADALSIRDEGVLVGGNVASFGLWAAIQNGVDYVGDEYAFSIRGEWDMNQGTPDTEGAYGAASGIGLNLGAAYYDDGGVTDGSLYTLDGQFTMGPFYASAAIVGLGDGYATPTLAGNADVGGTPFDVDAAFLFAGTWEAAIRYQTLDDSDSTSVIDLALNKYMEGHDAKFIIQYSTSTSDDATNEADIILLGMTVSV